MRRVNTIVFVGLPARSGMMALFHGQSAMQMFVMPHYYAPLSTVCSTSSYVENKKIKLLSEVHDIQLQGYHLRRQYRCDAGKLLKESNSASKSTSPTKTLHDTQYDPDVIGSRPDEPPVGENTMMHPVYTAEEVHSVKVTHIEPKGFVEKLAYAAVQTMRWSFDFFSGYKRGKLTEDKMLTRIIFLETTAGVPGMVGGMVRHLNSLRRMQRDHGWIHTLLSEAENERMHLMTALHLKRPGIIFRSAVLVAQGIFVNGFFLAYLCSPRFCHRFVGYLEEEAVKTYTSCLEHIDEGSLGVWNTKHAPKAAVRYWRLNDDATMRDMILAIRCDEAHHRQVNHVLASINPDTHNPFTSNHQQTNSIELTTTSDVVKQLDDGTKREASITSDNNNNHNNKEAKSNAVKTAG